MTARVEFIGARKAVATIEGKRPRPPILGFANACPASTLSAGLPPKMNKLATAAMASALALFAGCSQSGPEKFKAEILAADKAFAERSAKEGPKAAFLACIAGDGKLLNETRVGAAAVNTTFIQLPPTATLTWEPSFVDVSASGDLGYTWGRYALNVPSPKQGQPPYQKRGTYVTIWRRQPGGGWKFVLDGGNPDGQK